MSDEQQDLSFEDVGGSGDEAGGPRKPGIFSGLLLTILKWAAIVVGIIIVVVTVTVITIGIRDRAGWRRTSPRSLPPTSPRSRRSPTPTSSSRSGARRATRSPRPSCVEISIGYA